MVLRFIYMLMMQNYSLLLNVKKTQIKKAYQTLGIIKRNFIYLTPDSFVTLYKKMIRAHLEYAVSVWNPHY